MIGMLSGGQHRAGPHMNSMWSAWGEQSSWKIIAGRGNFLNCSGRFTRHWKKAATTTSNYSLMDVALLQVKMVILDKPSPIASVLSNPDFQPWLHVPFVVDYCCPVDLIPPRARIITKVKDMPTTVQSHCQVIKGDQTQWQAPCFPQLPPLSLQSHVSINHILWTHFSKLHAWWMFR